MGVNRIAVRGLLRRVPLLAVAVAGIVTIVGSGGALDIGCVFPPCTKPSPSVEVEPTRLTTSVGGSVVFQAVSSNVSNPSYQWCRRPPGSQTCTEIPGATGETYTAAGLNLADDRARYHAILITGSAKIRSSSSGEVSVSPWPGVVFQDGEFQASDWSAAAIASLTGTGVSYTVTRPTGGGNPGAFRSVQYEISAAGVGTVAVSHLAVGAIYDPAVQGAIYAIDFTEDCVVEAGDHNYTMPMIQQAGRTFVPFGWQPRTCTSSQWSAVAPRFSLVAAEFSVINSPPCGTGETCPDFSASGAPITLGLVSGARVSYPDVLPIGTASHGFDNWRATVWRKWR